MKGDFSRSTFDPRKHYSSVRMQQGRVQLDADWNEQADILLHLIATQLQDLLGPGSTSVACPGFAITPAEQDEERGNQPEESTASAETFPDFWIGAGRYYVDGILCENEEDVLFSKQPDYPAAASQLKQHKDHVFVYLDVWQRHLTAIEDPAIREIALGGADTATRVKTVWQVKLLPAPGGPANDQDWEAFVARTTDKGRLKAQWDKDERAFLENHLYRVEIHSVAGDEVTFKWSRENGAVAFPIREEYLFTWEDVPGNDNEPERLLSYLREGLALDWAKGKQVKILKPEDGKIRVEKGEHWAEIALNMEEKTATLKTSDGKYRVLKVRQENDKRRIYARVVRLNGEEYLFTWEDVPGNDNEPERLLSYLREGLALDWAKGKQVKILKLEDGKIRVEKGEHWAEIALNTEEKTATLRTSDDRHRVLKVKQENDKRRIYAKVIGLNLEGLDRDPYPLDRRNWGELVDDVTVLNGCPLPLCREKELDGHDGKVALWPDEESAKRFVTEIGARELCHPLLRRWEDDAKPIRPQTGTTTAQGEMWLSLENGIQVAFSGTGTYQVGDYWLIPARAQMEKGIEWPQEEDGTPRALPPHGIVHHYAPLALLHFEEKRHADDLRLQFDSLTDAKARLETRLAEVDVRLDEHKDNHDQLCHRVTVLEERQADFQAPLVQYFQTDNEIDTGHVVSVVPQNPSGKLDSELGVRLASADDREKRLVVGVVKDVVTGRNQGQVCRVVVYGRAQCRVVGNVEPGDVLVPSAKLGYAQKARRSPKPGTILGKALSSIQPDERTKEEIEGGKGRDRLDKSKWTGTVDMMVMLG